MSAVDTEIRRAEATTLCLVRAAGGSCPPADLIGRVAARGLGEHPTRIALWYLIDRHELHLTMDRLIRLVEIPDSAGAAGAGGSLG